MARILNIETSTRMCSVSLGAEGHVVAIRESAEKYSHAENITLFSEEVVKSAGLAFSDLDAVAVSMGPGSYTGLRIGVSTAKGYCYALNIPLIAVGSLEALAAGMIARLENANEHVFIPMIDARRMEVYMAVYDEQLSVIEPVRAEVIHENTFEDLLTRKKVVFAGDGSEKCKKFFHSHENSIFLDDFLPSAKFLTRIAEEKFLQKQFEDVAYFEPYYLKEFVAGIPKVKGLK
jgi:tRNA threonylcarbamoyladenosine biosynthesis protein TsaB